jgi:leucyl/phenylalanyl-tRNA--protein transferase
LLRHPLIKGIYFLDELYEFPDPKIEDGIEGGILAIGGDLNPMRLLKAYRMGIFPWYGEDDPILWWSPLKRCILYPEEFKLSKSFKRVLRNKKYRVTFDLAFEKVIKMCATIPRKDQNGTWINQEIINSYTKLYELGYAHCVEVWMEEELVGGLYGVALGGAFFGESMFSTKSNASKIALKAISDVLNKRGYDFIDCQVATPHLKSLGAVEIPKSKFLEELNTALKKKDEVGSWSNLKWEYSDG